MSGLSVHEEPGLPPLPLAGAGPAAVRAALRPEYRDAFDWDYQAVLNEAASPPDSSGVDRVVEHWRKRSWVTRDRDAHRQMVRRAAELLTGAEPPEDEPVAITELRL
jgi:hypothetical protein